MRAAHESAAGPASDAAAVRAYIGLLYGTAVCGFLPVFRAPEQRTDWLAIDDLDAAAAVIRRRSDEGFNVYHGLGLHPRPLGAWKRGKADGVCALPGLHFDLDVSSTVPGVHAETRLPGSIDEAVAFLAGFPLPASLLVFSGHGLYAHWLFREVLAIDGPEERARVAKTLVRLQGELRRRGRERGWFFESTADLARVLRPAGVLNRKTDDSLLTRLLHESGERYILEEIEDMLPDEEASGSGTSGNGQRAALAPILEGCPFMAHCRDDAEKLTEPEWHSMMTVVARSEDGERHAHALSEAYPGYSESETQKKYERAFAADKPIRCETVESRHGDDWCAGCEHRETIASPIELGRARVHRSAGQNGKTPHADAGETTPISIQAALSVFRRWHYMPDDGVVLVPLGAAAANLLQTDPTWLIVVGPPSGGKTETIVPLANALPYTHLAATLTEASLLSGTPKREKAPGSKGGLLREIGDFGILILKDFTSILSMNRDARAQLLAALREIFDGSWTRHIGTDGGRSLHWAGKLGLIAGCTAAIDNHHGVMSVMGERFLLYRLPEIDPEEQAGRALDNAGHEAEMREELAAAVRSLFAGIATGEPLPPIEGHERAALIALSSLVAAARSGVVRDGYQREVELVMDTEAPARLSQTLRRLYAGLLVIGLDRETAWPLVRKTGMDSIPKLRRSAFEVLRKASDWMTTTTVAAAAGYPTTTARRALEDLAAHGVVVRKPAVGKGHADSWRLSDLSRARYRATFPETSEAKNTEGEAFFTNPHRMHDDISGTPGFSASADQELGETGSRRCWQCKAVIAGEKRCEACEWVVCTCGACSPECPYWQHGEEQAP